VLPLPDGPRHLIGLGRDTEADRRAWSQSQEAGPNDEFECARTGQYLGLKWLHWQFASKLWQYVVDCERRAMGFWIGLTLPLRGRQEALDGEAES
jgi:hypothetical protein